jgi:hypothetical protein
MKLITVLSVVALLSACQASNQLKPVSQVEPGVASEGTLANENLIVDTSKALYNLPTEFAASEGSKILKFVIQKPVGKVGSKSWREMWIAKTSEKSQSFLITFTENGTGSASFEIKPISGK